MSMYVCMYICNILYVCMLCKHGVFSYMHCACMHACKGIERSLSWEFACWGGSVPSARMHARASK